jgi:hypothetical protein
MYTNIGQGATNSGGFVSHDYWSSSEYDYGDAWYQYFYDGGQNGGSKGLTLLVRAVRTF